MRYLALSILILSLLGMKSFAQDTTVRDLLLGNNPEAAFKPGIGQMIQPLVPQTPAINPLTGQVRTGPQTAPPPPPVVPDLKAKPNKNEYKFKTVYDYYEKDAAKKEDGKYGLWEIEKKKSTDPKVLRKEAIQRMILSNENVGSLGSQGSYSAQGQTAQVLAPTPARKKIIRIPYTEEPEVQTLPINPNTPQR